MDQFRARILPLSDQRVDDRDVAYEAMHFAAESFARWCQTAILTPPIRRRRVVPGWSTLSNALAGCCS